MHVINPFWFGAGGGGGGDPNFANVVMLYHFFETAGATTFDDTSSTNVNMVVGGGTAATVTGGPYGNWLDNPLGSWSNVTAVAAHGIGTQSFVMELLMRVTSLQARYVFDYSGALGSSTYPCIFGTGAGALQYIQGGVARISTANNVIIINTTQAICYQRTAGSNEGRLYVDGVSVGTWTDSTNYTSFPTTIRLPASTSPVIAKFGEVRVTIGATRYGTSYTPAVAAFPDS